MADDLVDVQDEIFTGSGDSGAPGDFQMPSQEELLATIEKMSGLDEATRKELLDGILGRQKMGGVAGEFVPPPVEKNTSLEIIMLFSMISAVFLVLVTMSQLDEVKSVNRELAELSKTIEEYYTHYQNEELTKSLLEALQVKINITLTSLATYIYLIYFLIALLFFIGAFFGYKLYKSLVERERRREEKKRQKLQKKKK